MLALARYSIYFERSNIENNKFQMTMLMLNAAVPGTSERGMFTVQTLMDDYFSEKELALDCEC